MNIVDTHSHIYDEKFDADINLVIERAKSAGVSHILMPNIDTASISKVNEYAVRFPGYCLPMMGLHPTDVTDNWKKDLSSIKKQFTLNKYIAVGEIGLDLYWDKSMIQEQKAALEEQLRWSIEFGLPVSLHSREAIGETIESIKNVGTEKLRGVFHSFGGSEEELQNILELKNFYIGINGSVTYKNSTLPLVLQNTDLSQIIVETDAPYLPPVPYRGKRNEPSYTVHVVKKLSEIYNVPEEEVKRTTSYNAEKLFNIKKFAGS
ncbi:MAG TPA: hydrolase TatD [Dysgonomonas sp.]|nr:hydrolase TatD [Dysgonomonas sp.]